MNQTDEVVDPEVMPKEAVIILKTSGIENSTAHVLESAFLEMAERERAEKTKAEQAPDKEKMIKLAEIVKSIEIPSLVSEKGVEIEKQIRDQFAKFATWIEAKSKTL